MTKDRFNVRHERKVLFCFWSRSISHELWCHRLCPCLPSVLRPYLCKDRSTVNMEGQHASLHTLAFHLQRQSVALPMDAITIVEILRAVRPCHSIHCCQMSFFLALNDQLAHSQPLHTSLCPTCLAHMFFVRTHRRSLTASELTADPFTDVDQTLESARWRH